MSEIKGNPHVLAFGRADDGEYLPLKVNADGEVSVDGVSGATTITGTDKQVMFFDGANTPAGNAGLTYDKTTGALSFAGNIPADTAPITVAGGDDDDGDAALVFDSADNYIALRFKKNVDIYPNANFGIYADSVNFEQALYANAFTGYTFDANVRISGYPHPLVVQTSQNDSADSPVGIYVTTTTQHSSGTVTSLTGLQVGTAVSDSGATQHVYAIKIEDQTVGSGDNYSIKTGLGIASFGDQVQATSVKTSAGYYIGATPVLIFEGATSANLLIGGAGNLTATGEPNLLIGDDTGLALTSGTDNVVVGANAMPAMTSGKWNVSIGNNTGVNVTSGHDNVFIGDRAAGHSEIPIQDNVIIGASAGGTYVWGNDNVIIGSEAGMGAGHGNVLIGRSVAAAAGDIADQLWIDNSATATPLILGDFSADTLTINGTLKASAYQSSDGTAGASAGPFTTITAITVKNGLVTSLTGS